MIELSRRLYMLLLGDGVSEHFNNQKTVSHLHLFAHPVNTVREGICGYVRTVAKRLTDALLFCLCLIRTILLKKSHCQFFI